MTRTVRRRFTARGVAIVETVHPQVGPIDRGRIHPQRHMEAAGAFGVWQVVDADHDPAPLLVVGDYLTAEEALLDRTSWADQPIPADELEEES